MQRQIQKEVLVPSSLSEVWQAWTTQEGVITFFARKARVELKIGGPYEMYFNLEAPIGSQGGEGLKILSYLPESMLSFEWNAPPHLPTVRDKHTWVVIQFEPKSDQTTQVRLTHLGWGEGEDWDQAYAYFLEAWDVVLARLVHRFTVGPIDWSNPYRPQG